MTPSTEPQTSPQAPPRPSPDIAVETWDPSLDPCAIRREAVDPSPWSAGSLAALLALSLSTLGALVPWRRPVPERAGFRPSDQRTIAFTLRDVHPAPPAPADLRDAPGGGEGRPRWAPISTAGPGGLGDLNALPTVKTLAPQGDLASPTPERAPTTALGGGLSPRLGVGGGSPMGVAGGQGGGSGKGLRSADPGAERSQIGTPTPMLIPVYRQDISYTLPKGSFPARIIVMVRALVDMDGTVKSVAFMEGPLPLKERAEAAALKWRFRPLAASGFREPVYVNIHFDSALQQRPM